jgi:hypothetical protein
MAGLPDFEPSKARFYVQNGPSIMRRRVMLLALVLAASLAAARQNPAQTTPNPTETTPPGADSQTGASRFALVTVLDPRGKPVVDVGADDFVVQEGGAAREVLSVRPADYPVVVMLDTGVDARADFGMMRKAAEHFIDRVGPRPLAIGTFGGTPEMIVGFEDERSVATERLTELAPATNTPSALLQGTALAAQMIRKSGALFAALVVLSSAPMDGSQTAPDDMIAAIVDSGAILHVVVDRSVQSTSGSGFRPGGTLRALAEQSRGEYTTIYSAASFQSALDRLAERLTTEMLVEYLVPVGSKPNDVKLGIRLVGARVRGLGVAPR